MDTKNIGRGGTATPRFLDDDKQMELPVFVTKTSLNELLCENSTEGADMNIVSEVFQCSGRNQ